MNGLTPAIVQNPETGEVLMLGYVNEESLRITIETGFVTFYSRSRQQLWKKGETSGNALKLIKIVSDCDDDALLIFALPSGPTCHTGEQSCFYKQSLWEANADSPNYMVLKNLETTISARKSQVLEKSYTQYLFQSGIDKILKKVGEESAEVIIAVKNKAPKEIIEESADLLYHLMVLWAEMDIPFSDILKTLSKRSK